VHGDGKEQQSVVGKKQKKPSLLGLGGRRGRKGVQKKEEGSPESFRQRMGGSKDGEISKKNEGRRNMRVVLLREVLMWKKEGERNCIWKKRREIGGGGKGG